MLIVEDGTIVPNANSYVTVLELDNYMSVRPTTAEWEDLDTSDKEAYLRWATRLLDQRATFYGHKTDTTSALRWPRIGVTDRDKAPVPYDIVPRPIKDAVIEIAYYMFSQGVDPSVPLSPGGEIQRVKLAVIEIEYTEGTQSNTLNYFPVGINDILRGLGTIQMGNGSRFGRILRS
jgi:hypothetical protein